jgi:hypothetical protein
MKKTILYFFVATIFLATACNSGTKETTTAGIQTSDKENTASFKIDGATINGKVSTQYFGSNKETDNFSVLCQQDEPLTLLQATFANEKNAKVAGLKPKGGSYKVNEGEYGLTLTIAGSDKEFNVNEKSGGSLKVEGNTLTITDIKLFDRDGKEKVVNAVIAF